MIMVMREFKNCAIDKHMYLSRQHI